MIVIEACTNGTITRANARALNRAICPCGEPRKGATCEGRFSGTTTVAEVVAACEREGLAYRVVAAAALAGADKGAHTREVNRSRKAQARRAERKAAEVAAA